MGRMAAPGHRNLMGKRLGFERIKNEEWGLRKTFSKHRERQEIYVEEIL